MRYHNGKVVRKSYPTSVKWYRRAVESGDDWAKYLLGLCYEDGEGVRRNVAAARKWFRDASDSGVREAQGVATAGDGVRGQGCGQGG